MKKEAGAGGIVLLLAVAVAHAAPPDALRFGTDVRAGRIDPATHDFAAANFWELDEAQRRTWPFLTNWVAGQESVNPGSSCEPVERKNFEMLAWGMLAANSADARDWREAHASVTAELARLDARLDQEAAAGGTGENPRLAELQRRFARDQAVRRIQIEAAVPQGMPPAAASTWGWFPGLRLLAIDCDNTRWLQQQLMTVRWFDIPEWGVAADEAAWHLVQHADRDPGFQRDMLAVLQSLPKDHTSQKRIAYLWDRVAGQDKKPQRYATQGMCQPDGSWKPHPVEDPAGLDARRRAHGMSPIAEHAVEVARNGCPQPAAK